MFRSYQRSLARKLSVLCLLVTCLIMVGADNSVGRTAAATCCSACSPNFNNCMNYCSVCGCYQQVCMNNCWNYYNNCRSTCDSSC